VCVGDFGEVSRASCHGGDVGIGAKADPCLAARNLFRVAFSSTNFFREHQQLHVSLLNPLLCRLASIKSILLRLFSTPSPCSSSSRTPSAIMAPPSLLRSSTRPNLYVCAGCAFRALQAPGKTTKRWIGLKYLAKVADAEKQWKEKAARINAGKEKSMLTILEERGLVQTITG
jgi:hypothetical protein